MLGLVHPAVPRWYHGYQDFHNSKKPVFLTATINQNTIVPYYKLY